MHSDNIGNHIHLQCASRAGTENNPFPAYALDRHTEGVHEMLAAITLVPGLQLRGDSTLDECTKVISSCLPIMSEK